MYSNLLSVCDDQLPRAVAFICKHFSVSFRVSEQAQLCVLMQ